MALEGEDYGSAYPMPRRPRRIMKCMGAISRQLGRNNECVRLEMAVR